MRVHLRATGMPLTDIARFTGAPASCRSSARARFENGVLVEREESEAA